MSYKFVVPSIRPKAGGDTTPPVESYDLDQKVRAAMAAGAFKGLKWTVIGAVVAGALLALAVLADSLPPVLWIVVAVIVIIAIGIVRGVWEASERGYDWSVRAASRAWAVDDAEIERRRIREDAELEAQKALAARARDQVVRGDDTDGNPLTLTDEQRLDLVALNMLERVYMYGQAATRDAMTHDGVCTQFEWNLVNSGVKAIGLRKKQTWQAANFGDAWALWRENVRLETDGEGIRYLMVLKPNGQWFALERIE